MRNTWWNFRFLVKLLKYLTIPANITCSKSTIKTLEEVAKKCLKLTIKTPERGQWCHSGVINIKFEHISRLLLLFLLLTLSIYLFTGMEQLSQFRWKLLFIIWIQMLPDLLLTLLLLLITVPVIRDLTKAIF